MTKPIVIFVEDISKMTKEDLTAMLEQAYEQGYADGEKANRPSITYPVVAPTYPNYTPFTPDYYKTGPCDYQITITADTEPLSKENYLLY